jgi:aryl-alcohol dehydrogenase-like predicted oxidoreductase
VDPERAYDIVDVMRTVAERHSATVAQVALAWLLDQPSVSSVIIGAKNTKQLKDNLGAVNVKLSPEDLKQLDEVSKLRAEYPGWMFGVQGSDRRPGEVRDWSKFAAAK